MKKNRRVLVADIGNTSILFGLFKNNELLERARVKSRNLNEASLRHVLKKFLRHEVEALVVASVVPQATKKVSVLASKDFGLKPWVVGQNLSAPIVNQYAKPKQVGVDRLMNAVAAFKKYKKECIVIDFGTAITLDIVSRRGEYLGGVIAPGIEVSLEALYERTALLPRIKLKAPVSVLGTSTVDSIRVGCSFGIGGLCDRLVEEIIRHCRFKPVVVATGGYAKFMSHYCKSIHTIDPSLTLRGIYLSYRNQNP